MFGLEKGSEYELRGILILHGVEKAIIFGSRGNGTYRYNSDIDIAIFGNFTTTEINQIRWDIEESRIIYSVDLVHYESIRDHNFALSVLEGKEFRIY